MKAVVVEKPGSIAVVERDIPEITENQVLVKVKAAGICGSDVHIFHGKNAFATIPVSSAMNLSAKSSKWEARQKI